MILLLTLAQIWLGASSAHKYLVEKSELQQSTDSAEFDLILQIYQIGMRYQGSQVSNQVVPPVNPMRLNLRTVPTPPGSASSLPGPSSSVISHQGHQASNPGLSVPLASQQSVFQQLRNVVEPQPRNPGHRMPMQQGRTVTSDDLWRDVRPQNFTRFPDLSSRESAGLASSVAQTFYDRNPNATPSQLHEDNRMRDALNYLNWRQDNQHVNYNILTYVSSKSHPFELYEYMLQRSSAASSGDMTRLNELESNLYRRMSNEDVMFVTECEKHYIDFMINTGLKYKRWGMINDCVIKNPIDDDAIVCIIGDWGTGLQDAVSLLEEAVFVRNATVILHLGDVYYSGLEAEMEHAVIKQIERIRQKAGINIRYYSVIGNHEYYCCATGFMNTLQKCNVLPQDQQTASYFCLRNKSGTWQFIGIDTGYLDSNPTNQLTFGVDPDLLPSERQWVEDKIKNFSGSTVLLSHHQLFSATQQITDLKGKEGLNILNPSLSKSLFEHLPNLSAWFWGHQHTVYFYENDFAGIPRSRLVGNSAFQIFSAEKPYQREHVQTNIPLLMEDDEYFRRFTPDYVHDSTYMKDYYDHTYAIIDFGKAKKGSIPCEYYNVKASYLAVPPLGKLWFSEQIPEKDFSRIPIPARKAQLTIKAELGIYIGKKKNTNSPMLSIRPLKHTFLKVSNKKNAIENGDQIKIIALDEKQLAKKFLTAFWNGIQYDVDHMQASTWIIQKMNYKPGSDPTIYYKDTFYLKSKIYSEYLSDIAQGLSSDQFGRHHQPYKFMCFMVKDKQGKQLFIHKDDKLTYSQDKKVEDGCITQ